MKISMYLTLLAASSQLLLAQSGGALTPSAAPGVTMKSLDQVEARTPLVDGALGVSVDPTYGTLTISQSGSYYLTSNLNVSGGDGIVVNAQGVSLDLNGFTISSIAAASTGNAVELNSGSVTVYNGHIVSGVTYSAGASGDQFTGTGFQSGVRAISSSHENIHIYNVSVSGVDLYGIIASGSNNTVESCLVRVAGSLGIQSGLVSKCRAELCGLTGINAWMVTDSYGESITGDGIYSIGSVHSSYGRTYGNYFTNSGIRAFKGVHHSHGSYEGSSAGNGIYCPFVTYSYAHEGSTSSSVYAIWSTTAIGCYVNGTTRITNKYLMP